MYDIFFNGALQPIESGRHADTLAKNCVPEEMSIIAHLYSSDDLSMVHILTPHAVCASTLNEVTCGFSV